MPVFNRLVALYEKRGFKVASGLNPTHFHDYALAPFTWLFDAGVNHSFGLGIAMQEVYFLECLFEDFRPRNIFVIGNSFGWSSLALALLNPQATVLAIDDGSDENAASGIDFTNRVAEEEGLRLLALEATSPAGVTPVIEGHLPGPVDFAFIDGGHSNEQIVLDYEAVSKHAAADCVYLFHDVHHFDLYPGFEEVCRRSGLPGTVLFATPSGMAILHDPANGPAIDAPVSAFAVDEAARAIIEREAWRRKHRLRVKYGRSAIKRLNALRKLMGRKPYRLP